jgi:hypothetical protein
VDGDATAGESDMAQSGAERGREGQRGAEMGREGQTAGDSLSGVVVQGCS